MRRLVLCTTLALGFLCASLGAHPAFAERRVALVIGNSAYQNAPYLPSPDKDAKAMAAAFQQAGFVVRAYNDLGYLQFARAILQFQDDAKDADIAVIYYAGRGVEFRGKNYLVPIDTKLDSDQAAKLEAITLDELQDAVSKAKQLQLIILDACSDNPFPQTMQRDTTSGGIDRGGLAAVAIEPRSNLLVAFAAKAGSVALSCTGDHSPYTTALLHNLFVPGLALQFAFARIRDEVLKSTHNQQEPYVYGSIGADPIALVPGAGAQEADLHEERTDYELCWKIAKALPNERAIEVWQAYLSQHPKGP